MPFQAGESGLSHFGEECRRISQAPVATSVVTLTPIPSTHCSLPVGQLFRVEIRLSYPLWIELAKIGSRSLLPSSLGAVDVSRVAPPRRVPKQLRPEAATTRPRPRQDAPELL